MRKYSKPDVIPKLNAFEIYCLIDVYRKTDMEKCKQLVEIMVGRDKANDYTKNSKNFNDIFDKVLNTKSTDLKKLIPKQEI